MIKDFPFPNTFESVLQKCGTSCRAERRCCRMAKKLTEKQKRFVEEYLIDLNATQAAIRAGYSPKTTKRKVG